MIRYSYLFVTVLLFIFDDLCREICFRDHFIANESQATHGGDATAHFAGELYSENERITRNNLVTELYIIDFQEIGRITFRFIQSCQHEQASCLCHGFYL